MREPFEGPRGADSRGGQMCSHQFRQFSPWPALTLDRCALCGLWLFDKGELAKALGEDPHVFPIPSQPPSAVMCPRCGSNMRNVSFRQEDPVNLQGHSCEGCGVILMEIAVFQHLKKRVLANDRRAQILPRQRIQTQPLRDTASDEFSFSRFDLFALLALSFTFAAVLRPIAWFFNMFFHEFGHAAAGWMTGRLAVPVLISAYTWVAESRSFAFCVFLVLVWGGLSLWCWKSNCRPLGTVFLLAVCLLLMCSLMLGTHQTQEIFLLGGLLGESLLPALLLLTFSMSAPRAWRWDFWRYPVCFTAGVSLSWIALHHLSISKGTTPLPLGMALGGLGGDGDLDRLIAAHNWTTDGLRWVFLWNWRVAVSVLGLSSCIWFLTAAKRTKRSS